MKVMSNGAAASAAEGREPLPSNLDKYRFNGARSRRIIPSPAIICKCSVCIYGLLESGKYLTHYKLVLRMLMRGRPRCLQLAYIWRVTRKRLQIELGPSEQVAFERIRGLGDNDAETGRRAIALLGRLAGAIEDGFTIVAVPADEARFADAAPELTGAIAPERRYRHLVRLSHPWRRQLSFKGRRLTVGQLIGQMTANGMNVETAATEFDLSAEAIFEAIEYAAHNRELLAAEAAEERRRVESSLASSA